jgi:hypothetical protein
MHRIRLGQAVGGHETLQADRGGGSRARAGTATTGRRVRVLRRPEAVGGATAVFEARLDLQFRRGPSGAVTLVAGLFRDQPSGSLACGGLRRVRRMLPDALHQQYRHLRSHIGSDHGEQSDQAADGLRHQQADGGMDAADLARGGSGTASRAVPSRGYLWPGDPENILRMIRAVKRGYFVFPGSRDQRKSYGYIEGLLDSFEFAKGRSEPVLLYN